MAEGKIKPLTATGHANTDHTGIDGVDPPDVTQAEAEAGTEPTKRSWSPERVAQAIAVLGPTVTIDKRTESFTPSLGQTIFTLAIAPYNPLSVDMFINTVKYINGLNFTVVGNQLTWSDFPFTLDSEDIVEIVYFV